MRIILMGTCGTSVEAKVSSSTYKRIIKSFNKKDKKVIFLSLDGLEYEVDLTKLQSVIARE